MKNRRKRLLGIALVLAMLFTMVGASTAVTYAAEPEILMDPTNIWLWPGEERTIGIVLSGPAEAVELEYHDDSMDEWFVASECEYQNAGKTMWYVDIPGMHSDLGTEKYIETYRYAIEYDGGKVKYSAPFNITWSNEWGYSRIAGANRFQTAMLAAESYIESTDRTRYRNVIIASGMDFADALGGTYLSVRRDAPILLVNRSPQVIQDVAGSIQKNLMEGGHVYILGGTGAVSADMEAALMAGGIEEWQITRFAGANRYDTNLQILRACGPVGEDVLVCCGTDFADALSASAVGLPILLVGKSLTKEQMDFLKICDPGSVNVIGGEGAVPKTVYDQIHNDVGAEGFRIAGANRYETSEMVAIEYFTDRQPNCVTLAYGLDFPDGLAGGPLSYVKDAPLLLVKAGNEQYAAEVVQYGLRSRYAVVLGGPTLIPDSTVEKIINHGPKG